MGGGKLCIARLGIFLRGLRKMSGEGLLMGTGEQCHEL